MENNKPKMAYLNCPYCDRRFAVEDESVPEKPVPKVILNGWDGVLIWDGKEIPVYISCMEAAANELCTLRLSAMP